MNIQFTYLIYLKYLLLVKLWMIVLSAVIIISVGNDGLWAQEKLIDNLPGYRYGLLENAFLRADMEVAYDKRAKKNILNFKEIETPVKLILNRSSLEKLIGTIDYYLTEQDKRIQTGERADREVGKLLVNGYFVRKGKRFEFYHQDVLFFIFSTSKKDYFFVVKFGQLSAYRHPKFIGEPDDIYLKRDEVIRLRNILIESPLLDLVPMAIPKFKESKK